MHGLRHERNVGNHRRVPNRPAIDRTHALPISVGEITSEAFGVGASLRAPRSGIASRPGARQSFTALTSFTSIAAARRSGAYPSYIGDGGTISRSMVRRRDDKLFGHTPVARNCHGVARKAYLERSSHIAAPRS